MKFKRGYYDIFLQTCAKNPSNIAVRHYNNGIYRYYTYSELYGVCEYISQNLQILKCNKGVIGLVSERNIIVPAVIAAAHKCSTTFMFIDPTQDVEKIANEVRFNTVINIQDKGSPIPELFNKKPDKSVSVFDFEIIFFDLQSHFSSKHAIFEHSFIAMTSGSTGEPKHIQVPMKCIQPNIDDLTKLFKIIPQDVIYFSTPLTFDPSMVEILLACMNGASLLIAPEMPDILFPNDKENSITFWQTTPSKFFQLPHADIKNRILSSDSPLKILALGGEPLNGVRRLIELRDGNNKTRIFTLYGVTEMSCWACIAEIDFSKILIDKEVPLGNCLSETQIHIEPENSQNKDTGKIILVSKSRKCIILNKSKSNEEENSLKFVDTGDIGEIKNGTIYYRGRRDDVVKRFGHKINLQSIESIAMQCPKVKTCSCVWLPKPLLLVVYFSSESLTSCELSDFLKCKLDDKHWPDKIVRVENLPMNLHGKISKSNLLKMNKKVSYVTTSLDSLKVLFQKELCLILNAQFTYDEIKYKDFFSIGGTSFLAVSLCNKISHKCSEFGKFILPYLMSQRYTIDEIMQLAQKQLSSEEIKGKGKVKRSRSNLGSSSETQIMKKANNNICTSPVEFTVLWSYDTGKCVDASPTLFQIRFNLYVIVGSHSGKIVIADAMSGELQGIIRIKARVEASVVCYCDESVTPACGMVGAYDGTIVCFAIDTCKEIWRININSMIKSKGVCCNGLLYIASYDGKIRCIDVLTGIIKDVIDVADQAISADLVLAKKEYVLLGTLSGVCASIHIIDNAVAWRGALSSPVFASPVIYDNEKYVVFAEVNGEIHCRTVEKGIKIWRYQGAKGNIFSSMYVKEIDKLIWQIVFGCHDNSVYSIKIKNYQPSLHWKTQLTSPVYSTPCSIGDKFILAASNNGKICILDSANGIQLAEYQLPNETFSSPAVYGDYVFIGCRNDHIYSLKCVLNL
ncbi:unnamed protein product [Chilo suppressalis]|uniref:AMP-dependent synthetase/ligase domain-containing protein n=1 Tax=Chilo suppressalis TaxID=168631 RepID=A0ABN8ATR5_CHISP|nr:unnamed protein product [Chilo suppressalis]